MESILKAETNSRTANLLISGAKFAAAAALAWKILPRIPHTGAVSCAVAASLITLRPDVEDTVAELPHDAFCFKNGLMSLMGGVQAVALLRGFSALRQISPFAALPVGAVLLWSTYDLVVSKGVNAGGRTLGVL